MTFTVPPSTMHTTPASYTTFSGHRRIARGTLAENALAIKHAALQHASAMTFCDQSGALIDIDTSGSEQDMLARLPTAPAPQAAEGAPSSDVAEPLEQRGRGRPKLGVIAREVTLLPRHWDWLAAQPGGASVSLRKLVDEARKAQAQRDGQRQASERAYRFMAAMTGDMAGFEEASRALFANDADRFAHLTQGWPDDVRDYLHVLAAAPPPTTARTEQDSV